MQSHSADKDRVRTGDWIFKLLKIGSRVIRREKNGGEVRFFEWDLSYPEKIRECPKIRKNRIFGVL